MLLFGKMIRLGRIWLILKLFLLLLSLLLIFSLADLRWNKDHPIRASHELHYVDSSLATQLIVANFSKVNEEIKQSSGYMNDQFNKKFTLVGGLLAFIALFIREYFMDCIKNKTPLSNVENHLMEMCKTDVIWAILALAVIICISIDLQERCKTNISNTHGAWIARYIEDPILNGYNSEIRDVFECNQGNGSYTSPDLEFYKKIVCNKFKEGPRNGSESYLRLTKDDNNEPVSGFHHDELGHLLFAVQFHYLTIVLYIIYIALLWFAFLRGSKNQLQNRIALSVLVIVQLSILGFAIVSRHWSEVFDVEVIPIPLWLSGMTVLAASFLLGIVPTIILWFIIIKHLCKGAGIIWNWHYWFVERSPDEKDGFPAEIINTDEKDGFPAEIIKADAPSMR